MNDDELAGKGEGRWSRSYVRSARSTEDCSANKTRGGAAAIMEEEAEVSLIFSPIFQI